MKIIKFDPRSHSISRAADLVLSAYGMNPRRSERTKQTIMTLIETGGNFLGKENLYIAADNENIEGLVICYPGKPGGTITALMRLLLELRLKELFNLIVLNAELLHTGYTPDVGEDDFYISLVVVDPRQRGKGLGTELLRKAIELAEEKGSSRVVLDVDSDNRAAMALYEKLGFTLRDESPKSVNGALPAEIFTMDYQLHSTAQKTVSRVKA